VVYRAAVEGLILCEVKIRAAFLELNPPDPLSVRQRCGEGVPGSTVMIPRRTMSIFSSRLIVTETITVVESGFAIASPRCSFSCQESFGL